MNEQTIAALEEALPDEYNARETYKKSYRDFWTYSAFVQHCRSRRPTCMYRLSCVAK